jgi:hypothetical protein
MGRSSEGARSPSAVIRRNASLTCTGLRGPISDRSSITVLPVVSFTDKVGCVLGVCHYQGVDESRKYPTNVHMPTGRCAASCSPFGLYGVDVYLRYTSVFASCTWEATFIKSLYSIHSVYMDTRTKVVRGRCSYLPPPVHQRTAS